MNEYGDKRHQLHLANSERVKDLLGSRNNNYETSDILAGLAPERMDEMLGDLEDQLVGAGNNEVAKRQIRERWLENAKIAVDTALKEGYRGDYQSVVTVEDAQEFTKSKVLEKIDRRQQNVEKAIEESEKLVAVIRKELMTLRREITDLEQKASLTLGEREKLKLFQTKNEELRTNLRHIQQDENDLRDRLEKLVAERKDAEKMKE